MEKGGKAIRRSGIWATSKFGFDIFHLFSKQFDENFIKAGVA
jgi:hypothetical protein